MTDSALFDQRPIIVAIAGPNGAGKTTFFRAHLATAGLLFVNADILAEELAQDPYGAARLATALRTELRGRGESFVFETVFSDPVGEKIAFLEEAVELDYTVVLCFIGLADPDQSIARVAMRVSQGGHDVADEKLQARFPRTLANLRSSMDRLPNVLVYDNSDLRTPYRHVATFETGRGTFAEAVPEWLPRPSAG